MLFVASSIQPLGHRMDTNNKSAIFQLPSENNEDGVDNMDTYDNNDSNFESSLSETEKSDIIRMHNAPHLYNKLGKLSYYCADMHKQACVALM